MAFLFFSVLLVTTWRGRLQGILLAVACLGTAMWAGVAAYLAARPNAVMLAAEMHESPSEWRQRLFDIREAEFFNHLRGDQAAGVLGYARPGVGKPHSG